MSKSVRYKVYFTLFFFVDIYFGKHGSSTVLFLLTYNKEPTPEYRVNLFFFFNFSFNFLCDTLLQGRIQILHVNERNECDLDLTMLLRVNLSRSNPFNVTCIKTVPREIISIPLWKKELTLNNSYDVKNSPFVFLQLLTGIAFFLVYLRFLTNKIIIKPFWSGHSQTKGVLFEVN